MTHFRLTFLRHAESTWNQLMEEQGQLMEEQGPEMLDCPLSSKGEQQASLLMGHFDVVIHSPLLRARQTFALSQIKSPYVIQSELVREFRIHPCDWMKNEVKGEPETPEELSRRADSFLEWIHEHKELLINKTILIVTHGDFICELTGFAPENARTVEMKLPIIRPVPKPKPILTSHRGRMFVYDSDAVKDVKEKGSSSHDQQGDNPEVEQQQNHTLLSEQNSV